MPYAEGAANLWDLRLSFVGDYSEALDKDAMDAKRKRWLQFHGQKTGGIMGLLPLVRGLPMRLTSTLNWSWTLLHGI